jgi:hypothetical protein
MFAQKLLLPAFAIISVAAAQSATICSQPTATINSQADAALYSSCSTIKGNVVIGMAASGSISLDGPQQITGDFTCFNATGLTSLGSSTIGSIAGTFSLSSLTTLSNLQFSDLTSVGHINFQALPALPQFGFTSTISKATSLVISNTFLSTLDGINLKTADTIEINNNDYLREFSTQVSNVTTSIDINSNGNQLAVSFPNLIWAGNFTLKNASSVSIPSLHVVNGSLGFYGNLFTSIAAPNLTTVGNTLNNAGGLAIVANGNLVNISFPALVNVGGEAQVANNTGISDINFPLLSIVGGAVDFTGNYSSVELPALTNVKGAFNLQSTAQFSCAAFANEHGNSKTIQGAYTCETTSNPSTLTGTSTGTGSSPSSTGSKGAAVSYGVNEAVAGLSVLGSLLQMLL